MLGAVEGIEREEPSTMERSAKAVPTTIGLDIAKNFFQAHAVDAAGRVVLRRKLNRGEVLRFFEGQPKALVGIEACGTGHYWARAIAALGHEVRLLPPTYVKAYVKRGKTDAADAEAICEAVTRPNMHFVPIKTPEQQAALMMHRSRELLVGQRTALVNALRGHLAELGIITAKGIHRVADLLAELIGADDEKVPSLARASLNCLAAQIEAMETQIDKLEALILEWHKGNEASQRLARIPGVGPITASAVVATIGDASSFTSARHLSAAWGLTPKQNSSGGKARQGGISKAGNAYLRRLLFIGAIAVIRSRRAQQVGSWLAKLLERRPAKVVAIALANKTARVIWAMLRSGDAYRVPKATAATA
jgi:transposase